MDCRVEKAVPANNRREFLKHSGRIAGAAVLAGAAVPLVHAGEDHTIRLALVGCGSRGAGAAENALLVKQGPVKLVAMADVFPHRLEGTYKELRKQFADARLDVPKDRQFIGFDAYQNAIDCLRPGDVAILATPPAFRWLHFRYAIAKGVNVFMEKPTTVDGPTTRKMLALADESVKKNLKVGVGLMCRHSRDRWELFDRIKAGQIGDLVTLRAYRLHGPVGSFFSTPKPADMSELLYQINRFHSFLWASGGAYSDAYVHHIDECCWMKDAWPVQAQALGGRHYRGDMVDQNFDTYSVEYTFADGAKFFLFGRSIAGCYSTSGSYAHGTKGLALISVAGHSTDKCRIFKGQNPDKSEIAWKYSKPAASHYQLEWDDLMEAIRRDKPYNEARRGAEASLVTAMGRMAAHTGRVITYDEILNGDHEFAPGLDQLSMDSPAPLRMGSDGKYPVPQPGIVTKREY
jgi:predicted dehydrogenase